MNHKNRLALRLDAVFLIMSGAFGLFADILSYLIGAGPFAQQLMGDPLVIGVIEAHGLAVLTGIAAWAHSTRPTRYWHWHLAITHALLGGANIAFFQVFINVGAEGGGVVVTAIHFLFVLVQSWLAMRLQIGNRTSGSIT